LILKLKTQLISIDGVIPAIGGVLITLEPKIAPIIEMTAYLDLNLWFVKSKRPENGALSRSKHKCSIMRVA
jgi:hypothetical protein